MELEDKDARIQQLERQVENHKRHIQRKEDDYEEEQDRKRQRVDQPSS